jgi:sigma-E factor negative regulatory protein RseB
VRTGRLALGVAAAGATAVLGLGPAAPAQPAGDAGELLNAARSASEHASYAGVLAVTWRDHGHLHRTETYAHVADGVVEVGGGSSRVLSRGGQRWVGAPGAWSLVLGLDTPAAAPPPVDSHWDLRTAVGPSVSGRATTLVLVVDPRTDATRARFYLDRVTGMLLRRDVLDAQGRLVREVAFDAVVPLAPTGASLQPAGAQAAKPRLVRAVPSGYPAPRVVGRGYRLLGRYRQPDGSVQLYYGDGLFTLSLFEQRGTVDWESLPAGTTQHVHRVETRAYATPTTSAVVWGVHGVVITCISDGPPDEVMQAVRDVVGGGAGRSFGADVARFVLRPFGWD